MPLVINALGDRHIDRQTHILTCEQKQFQETRHKSACGRCVCGLTSCATYVQCKQKYVEL